MKEGQTSPATHRSVLSTVTVSVVLTAVIIGIGVHLWQQRLVQDIRTINTQTEVQLREQMRALEERLMEQKGISGAIVVSEPPGPPPGMAVKEIAELGIRLVYPQTWGEMSLETVLGEIGTGVIGTFTNGSIRFGAMSADFLVGREGVFFDIQGFRNVGAEDQPHYEFRAVFDRQLTVPPEAVIGERDFGDVKALLVRGVPCVGLCPATNPGKDHVGAIVNLPSTLYPGMAFVTPASDQAALELLLRQVELVSP